MANPTLIPAQIRPLVGSHTRKGKAGEDLEVGQVVHKDSNGDWVAALADDVTTGLIGICVSGAKGNTTIVKGEEVDVVTYGPVAGFTDLDVTKNYYLDDVNAGKMVDTGPDTKVILGYPESAQIFYVNPDATFL